MFNTSTGGPNDPKIKKTSESLKLLQTDVYRTNLQLLGAVCTQMFSAILFHTFHSNLHYTHGTFMKSMFFSPVFSHEKKEQNKTNSCLQEIDQQHGGHPFFDCCDLRSPKFPKIAWSQNLAPRRRLSRLHHEEVGNQLALQEVDVGGFLEFCLSWLEFFGNFLWDFVHGFDIHFFMHYFFHICEACHQPHRC